MGEALVQDVIATVESLMGSRDLLPDYRLPDRLRLSAAA